MIFSQASPSVDSHLVTFVNSVYQGS
jgi:hypothetical protein